MKKTVINKGTGEEVSPEKLMDLILGAFKSASKVKDMNKFLGEQLVDDIMFSKVTANRKELTEKFGEPFIKAYNSYKKGRGAKERKKIAEFIKTKKKAQKQKDLNNRIDKLIKNSQVVNPNPDPDNEYMRFVNGEWVDYSPKNLAKLLADKEKETIKKIKEDESKRAMKTVMDFTKRLQESTNKLNKALEPQTKAMDSLKKNLKPTQDAVAKVKGVELKGLLGQPIKVSEVNNIFNPFSFNNALIAKRKSLFATTKAQTILSQNTAPKPKPEGSKRRPITGVGLNTYMQYHKLDNPVDVAKKYLTKEGKFKAKDMKLELTGFNNLMWLCDQMNVTVQEAFLYICEGMTDTKQRWLLHRVEKEFWRGSQSFINLVQFFDEKVANSKKRKGELTYTLKMLWNSEYYKKFAQEHDMPELKYSTFTKWFKTMRYHVDVLKLANKKKN